MALRKTTAVRQCIHCGETFETLVGRQRICTKKCADRAQVKERQTGEHRIPMDPAEEAKMLARLKRRLLDGVLLRDLEGMYASDYIKQVMDSLTPEELVSRGLNSDDGWREKAVQEASESLNKRCRVDFATAKRNVTDNHEGGGL